MKNAATLLLLLLLAACGDLPQPFLGNPGATATRLAQPPPSRLLVPSPSDSLLSNAAADTWSGAVADALAAQEIPAAAGVFPRSRSREWTLLLAAHLRGALVVPTYTVRDPLGHTEGTSEGAPIPASRWAGGDPAVLKAAATQAAPGIATLLNRISAARQESDPHSLLNRPARIYLAGVTGAPGDGDHSLPAQMRLKLAADGLVVQDTAIGADYKLEGKMDTAPGANGTIRIELQWIVSDGRGERGKILQINEVPRNTIVPYWGDVAVAVAGEAASGVKDVVINAIGARDKAKGVPAAK